MSSREQVLACWLGKAVGGTLGQTFEGLEGPLDATFYEPVPIGMVPNDDLDLQVVFACVIRDLETATVDRQTLAAAWKSHVLFPWNEYGIAMRNYAEGLRPPHTGSFDNWFTCGEGAAIRSELWACLAPGEPDIAAAYAYEDACFDHADEGIDAAIFLARLQSAAFEESDVDTLLDVAVAGLRPDSELRAVVADTRRWTQQEDDWRVVRRLVVQTYGRGDFTDVRQNTGFILIGWLMGKDFSERICITNNCGADTDSSTASLGALLGILDPSSIDPRWLEPIGQQLLLSPEIHELDAPSTLDEFTDLVLDLRQRLAGALPPVDHTSLATPHHPIPAEWAWINTQHGSWDVRDLDELPPVGSIPPLADVEFEPHDFEGTWVTLPRDSFEDRILLMRYSMDAGESSQVRLMFNCTEPYRVWLDGNFIHGAQGTHVMMPAPHAPPVGQFVDLTVTPGGHDLLIALRQPPESRDFAEWVLALVELPSAMWIANAFRPHFPGQARLVRF